MLPSTLIPTLAREAVAVPPPPSFRPIVGKIKSAGIARRPPPQLPGRTAAQKAGLRYEAKVHDYLQAVYGAAYDRSPVLFFEDETGSRLCAPDGLLSVNGRTRVVEIKTLHTPDAWWQLRKLYAPVVRYMTNEEPILIEICHTYDPACPYPEDTVLLDGLLEFSRHDSIGVFRWRP